MLSKPIISSCATAIIILACCGVIWISLRCWRYRTASNKDVDLESAAKSTEDGPHLPVGGVNTSNIAATNGSPRPDGKFLHAVSWEEWWTYDGISGPAFWGLINPEWSLCNKGRRQSPVNLEPQRLLFDPNLRPMHIDKHRQPYLVGIGNLRCFCAAAHVQ
ncbi:hypothetical protein ACLKA7_001416 [Drosophila subpalustris]